MRKLISINGIIFSITLLALLIPGISQASGWRIGVGPAAASGLDDITDLYEDNLNSRDLYNTYESIDGIPIGVSFQAFYEQPSGLAFGVNIGPYMYISGDARFRDLPVDLGIKYLFSPESRSSAYIRLAARTHTASGSYVIENNSGGLAAIGMEFIRKRNFGLAVELGADSSSVTFEDWANGVYVIPIIIPIDYQEKEIKPTATTLSLHVFF